MGMNRWIAGLAVGLSVASVAQPALQARDLDGNGQTDAYYDTELNITWLRDWNYAMTSGYDADGLMTWAQAKTWTENLSFGGHTGWRLPTMVDTGSAGCNFSLAGGTDCGYNTLTKTGSTVFSELAHLFHVTLGNLSKYTTAGTLRGGSSGTDWGLVNVGGFENMQSYVYWSGLDYFSPGFAWAYRFSEGLQGIDRKTVNFYAIAVRPGDVQAAIPEPEILSMTLLGLATLAAIRRKRHARNGALGRILAPRAGIAPVKLI